LGAINTVCNFLLTLTRAQSRRVSQFKPALKLSSNPDNPDTKPGDNQIGDRSSKPEMIIEDDLDQKLSIYSSSIGGTVKARVFGCTCGKYGMLPNLTKILRFFGILKFSPIF